MNPETRQKQKTIVVRVSKLGIHLNPKLLLAFEQTNIPPALSPFFKPEKAFYWLLEQKAFDAKDMQLKVEVRHYNTTQVEAFQTQRPKKEIRKLCFESLDWKELEQQLFGYKKSELRTYSILRGLNEPSPVVAASEKISAVSHAKTESYCIELSFSKSLTSLKFGLGCVHFKKHIPQLNQTLAFEIENPHILPEFDFVKAWFAKALKNKKVEINLSVEVSLDHCIKRQTAQSQDIDRINEALIATVKFQRTLGLTKKPIINAPDSTLFSAEDFFESYEERGKEANVFHQSAEDLMNDLLQAKEVRNKKNIRYLAELQSPNYPLKFTQYPDFGFLFFLEGESHDHFAWELLDSHATYLWSFEKQLGSVPQKYGRMEAILGKLRELKRDPYKRAYKEGLVDPDVVFYALHHKHKNSPWVDGFPRWRHEVLEKLV